MNEHRRFPFNRVALLDWVGRSFGSTKRGLPGHRNRQKILDESRHSIQIQFHTRRKTALTAFCTAGIENDYDENTV
jgi:hypothetical protein